MVPLLNEGVVSRFRPSWARRGFSGTPQAAALLLRDAVWACASQERPVQVATAESLTGGDVGGAICIGARRLGLLPRRRDFLRLRGEGAGAGRGRSAACDRRAR